MSLENEEGRPRHQRRDAANSGREPGLKSSPRRRAIRDEFVTFHVEDVGKVAAVVPVIPDDAPYRVREGIARRRLVAVTGECPCGARLDHAAVRRGEASVAEVESERLCPADTTTLAKAIRRWAR